MVVLLWAVSANAGCPEQPESAVLAEAHRVLRSFDTADGALLTSAREALAVSIGCLDAPPGPGTLRVVHRAMALVAYADRDREGATRAWAALRSLDASLTPDVRRFPRGHGIWATFEATADADDATRPLESIGDGTTFVDGRAAVRVPTSRAFLLAASSQRGRAVYSRYHYRAEELGLIDFRAPPARRRTKSALLGVGGGLLAAGTGVLISAGVLELDTLSGSAPADEIFRQQDTANRRYLLGSLLGGAGAVLTTAGLSIRW